MTLSDMITQARSMINQTDSANSQITNSQLTTWANEAYRTIITRIGAIPETSYDLTSATGDMTVNSNVQKPLRAYMYRPDSAEYERLEIIGIDMLDYIDASWLSADTGTPNYFVRKSTFTYYLYPQPDSDNTSQTIKFHAISFPTDLSSDSDVPDLPKNLQDLFPYFMAYRAFAQMGQEEQSVGKLIFFNTQMKADRQSSAKFSGQRNSMKWSGRADD